MYPHFVVTFIVLSKYSICALWMVNCRQLENQSNLDYKGSRRKLLNDQLHCECSPPVPPHPATLSDRQTDRQTDMFIWSLIQ